MGVGTNQRVRVSHPLAILQFTPHRFSQVFEVNLVADPRPRRYNAEAAECLLPPFQKHIALVVTLHFQANVLFERIIITEVVYRHRVVNHQINR
ncbi:hypothetical protein D3C73_1241380 [compost metagenome]